MRAEMSAREVTIHGPLAWKDARAAGLLLHQAIDASGLGIVEWVERVEQPIFGGDRGKHARQGDATGPLLAKVTS